MTKMKMTTASPMTTEPKTNSTKTPTNPMITPTTLKTEKQPPKPTPQSPGPKYSLQLSFVVAADVQEEDHAGQELRLDAQGVEEEVEEGPGGLLL
jgi:hypothetical protein